MKRLLEEYRERTVSDESLDDYARGVIMDIINDFESMVNSEIKGSIALIKRPLSEQLDWYFTYGDNRVLPIKEPDEFRDRDAVTLAVILTAEKD